jgi:sugar O-acyltransferase (sialic acid O-acetyltransferase NeuD family)
MSAGRLLILGASGHGKVVGDCARASGLWQDIVFYDDRWPALQSCGPWRVTGSGETLAAAAQDGEGVIVAIGDAGARMAWLRRLEAAGAHIVAVTHPSATVSADAAIGAGTVVVAGAVVNIGARLGRGCIINSGAVVDHDCELAEGVHVCPRAALAGNVRVGRESWIGIGSSVRQGIVIGERVMVAAGAVVVADVESDVTVAGIPARRLASTRASDTSLC